MRFYLVSAAIITVRDGYLLAAREPGWNKHEDGGRRDSLDHRHATFLRHPEALELQGLIPGCLRRPLRLAVVCAMLCAALSIVLAATAPGHALAAGNPPGQPSPISAPPGSPVLVAGPFHHAGPYRLAAMTKPPSGFRLTGNQVLDVALKNTSAHRGAQEAPAPGRLRLHARHRGVAGEPVHATGPGGSRHQIEMLQLYVSDSHWRGHPGLDRLPGRVDDGAWLSRAPSARCQLALHLAAALRRLFAAVHSLATAADPLASGPADAARVLDLVGFLQQRQPRAVGAVGLPVHGLSAGAHAAAGGGSRAPA